MALKLYFILPYLYVLFNEGKRKKDWLPSPFYKKSLLFFYSQTHLFFSHGLQQPCHLFLHLLGNRKFSDIPHDKSTVDLLDILRFRESDIAMIAFILFLPSVSCIRHFIFPLCDHPRCSSEITILAKPGFPKSIGENPSLKHKTAGLPGTRGVEKGTPFSIFRFSAISR